MEHFTLSLAGGEQMNQCLDGQPAFLTLVCRGLREPRIDGVRLDFILAVAHARRRPYYWRAASLKPGNSSESTDTFTGRQSK
jgi:hypothetical protein